ncbi:MAG: MBL fold metallo-hydrolase [Candidatus Moraniibacteriota bacterium]
MSWGWLTKSTFFSIGLAASILLGAWLWYIHENARETRIIFLSVGEGDAILITKGNNQILVDGGREGKRLLAHLGGQVPFYDRKIETVIATHPDADHIGGLPELFRKYQVDAFLSTGAKSDTETVKLLERELEMDFHGMRLPAFRGAGIALPDGGVFRILFPETPLPERVDETNRGSVVGRFTYGETSFLLTGDLPDEEAYLPLLEPVTVLKAAHHGSRYSTSEAWLSEVTPREAIISVGENSYGHPSPDVLERLTERGVRILRTDELGDIVYRCRPEWQGCRRDEEPTLASLRKK